MTVSVEITDEDGITLSTQKNTWIGLAYWQLLFMEKHLLGALTGMNEEATSAVEGAIRPEDDTPSTNPSGTR